MSPALAAGTAERAVGTAPYQRHRPEHTLLYQIVEQHYPAFVAHLAEQERPLPLEKQTRCHRFSCGCWRRGDVESQSSGATL
jgi:hypothetical protein